MRVGSDWGLTIYLTERKMTFGNYSMALRHYNETVGWVTLGSIGFIIGKLVDGFVLKVYYLGKCMEIDKRK